VTQDRFVIALAVGIIVISTVCGYEVGLRRGHRTAAPAQFGRVTIDGSDIAGEVRVTFNQPWFSAPACVVTKKPQTTETWVAWRFRCVLP
jgi:hypothetical protein